MRIPTGIQSLLALLMVGALVGCSGNNGAYETTPVKGVATFQGKPIANATINFTPMVEEGREKGNRGRVALGMTDKDGKFELTTYKNYDGAIIGRHTVTVSMNMDEATQRVTRLGCEGKSLEVTVKPDIKDYKVEF